MKKKKKLSCFWQRAGTNNIASRFIYIETVTVTKVRLNLVFSKTQFSTAIDAFFCIDAQKSNK